MGIIMEPNNCHILLFILCIVQIIQYYYNKKKHNLINIMNRHGDLTLPFGGHQIQRSGKGMFAFFF